MDEVKSLLQKIRSFVQYFCQRLKVSAKHLANRCRRTWRRFLRHFTRWIDPKLEPYRSSNRTSKPAPAVPSAPTKPVEPFVPTTVSELLSLLRHTPAAVLTDTERQNIIAAINFPHEKVSGIMLPSSKITYVHEDETLGPLVLDQLYRSGFRHFPVKDSHNQVIGLIHTTSLNQLDNKATPNVRDLIDPTTYYLRSDYTLSQALAAFLRTNCFFFLVVNRQEHIVGLLTYQMLIEYLLGSVPTDTFDQDTSRSAVAKRKV